MRFTHRVKLEQIMITHETSTDAARKLALKVILTNDPRLNHETARRLASGERLKC